MPSGLTPSEEGITQEQSDKLAGVPHGSLSKLENGQDSQGHKTAKVVGVSSRGAGKGRRNRGV